VCILVLKKCKKYDDVLFINASEHFKKGKRQNKLREQDIDKIISTYQYREVQGTETDAEKRRYARKVNMDEIEKNDFNLNISRYVSTAMPEEKIDIQAVNDELVSFEKNIVSATTAHNAFLEELGLPPLP
jgi:type I restriction enzyme M protein